MKQSGDYMRLYQQCFKHPGSSVGIQRDEILALITWLEKGEMFEMLERLMRCLEYEGWSDLGRD